MLIFLKKTLITHKLTLVRLKETVTRDCRYNLDVLVCLAAFDEKLDEKGYIVPGPGDAGGRLPGTA